MIIVVASCRPSVAESDVPRKNVLSGNRARQPAPPRAQRDADDLAETVATGCPLTAAIRALGGKWNLILLYWLDLEPRRFGELRRLMPGISHKVLTQALRVLERERLVEREIRPGRPAGVEYRLTRHGESVRPLIAAVRAWGRGHLAAQGLRGLP
jgi:DNA-binding HxlR family transcriptional regulator